jgi:D-alanyl-D-alanine carboxypeptidase
MSRRRAMLALFGVAITFGLSAASAPAHTVVAAKPSLRQLAQRIVDAGAPGALVAVRDSNGTRVGAAGFANLRTKERLRPADAFRVGSITKSFVSTVVLQLAGEGVLSLDDPVEKWLPGLVPRGGSITLRMLLNHTSGIYNYTGDKRFQDLVRKDRLHVFAPEELVAIAVAHRPLFEPGKDWSYSSTGYILLGLVVEKATGTTLEQQLRKRIFEPLGLTRTSLPSLPTLPPPFAHGYLLPGNPFIPVKPKRRLDVTVRSPSGGWAAGALVSTAADVARFYAALLGGRLLRANLLQQMTRTVPMSGSPGYGLGLSKNLTGCGDGWGHDGAGPGYTSLARSTRDGSRQFIALINTSPSPTSRVLERVGDALESAFCP